MTHTRNHRRTARRAVSLAATALAATAGITVIAAPATAATTTSTVRVTASDDSYVSSRRPTYSFGSSDSIVAGTKSGDRMVSFLKFTVGTLPAGASVDKVELKLTRDPAVSLPSSIKVKKVANTSWTEAALTDRNAPAVGAEAATVSPSATAAAVSFNLTGSVTKAGTYTFAVTSSSTTALARFRSTEQGANGPQLTLTLKNGTTAPVTPAPVTPAPTTPAPTTPAPAPGGGCTLGDKLVPTCNVLWGAAAGGFSDTPRDQALHEWEAKSGRTASIYHTYHRGDELFPTKAEIAMANETGKPRILFTNWKVGYGTTWGKVAAGEQDARIDRLSTYIKTNYGKDKFFMAVHHEPENDVSTVAGSGMTAKDYAAMFRHTVERMRADGVTNVVFVMAYMNVEKWNNSSWWYDLYPGNDVVDWVGVDSYVNAQPKGFHNGDFNNLMNRTTDKAKFPGWYTWAVTKNKPVMVAEWAVYECKTTCSPTEKANLHAKVVEQMKAMPAIKALVAFDTASDQQGLDMRIDSTPEALASFKKIAADKVFEVRIR